MSGKSTDSLRNMCRTCMSAVSDTGKINKQSIYEVPIDSKENSTSIMGLLQQVQPQIKVQIKDDLPKLICTECIKKLQLTHEFLQMYKYADETFRQMLKEGTVLTDTKKYSTSISERDGIIGETDPNTVNLDEDDEIHTKFEIEIENLNEGEFNKEEDGEEAYANVNDWPQFEDEPQNEISDEDVIKVELFDNPYSDASDNEATVDNIKRQNQTQRKTSPRKRTTKLEIVIERNISEYNCSKRKISKNLEEVEETQVPSAKADGTIMCQECDAVLENVTLWQQHKREHRLEKLPKKKNTKKADKIKKDHKCEHCGKEFPKATAYQNHLRTHTGEQPFLCMICGKSFKVVSSLNTHMLRHKGDKTVQCPQCPKKFVCSSGLYGHMMVHTKEKPFVCDICGSAFHMAYQLRKHNLYHNNIKNYQCEYCDMRFVTGEKQRRHMRTHTGEKPYRCKYCDRAFAQSNDCIKHLRQHLGDNVYQCELCPLRFPLARDLRVHFASHKDDDEETRARNLEARTEEERNLQIKLGAIDV